VKSDNKQQLNEQAIKQALGRIPSPFEIELISHYYLSKSIENPFPEFESLTSKSKVSFQMNEREKLIIGSEGKRSIVPRSSKRILTLFGTKHYLKYKSKLSTISFGVANDYQKSEHQIQGNEELIFIQDHPSMIKVCNELLDLNGLILKMIDPQILGVTLFSLILKQGGMDLYFSSQSQIKILSDKKTHGAMIIIEPRSLKNVNSIIRKNKCKALHLGKLKESQFITINIRKKTKAHLPVSAFNISDLPTSSLIPAIKKNDTDKVSKLPKDKRSYNSQLMDVWKLCKKKPQTSFFPSKNQNGTIAILSKYDSVAVSIPDNIHFLEKDLKNGSSLLASNAARQLACKGYKPMAAALILHGTDLHKNDPKWNMNELYTGAAEACQSMGIPMSTPIITSGNVKKPSMELCISGTRISDKDMGSFSFENDFITLLGSHRGDLKSSVYMEKVLKKKSVLIPTVDLRMEGRLQETVMQGIQTGLIHSAMNISNGGLAIALVRSIKNAETGLGARIHLSRKLRQDEMLFGETQGMVLVSIGERDLMEFERICMTIGIPSTTIGRVTNDSRFKFNDVVNIERKKL